MNYLDKVLGIKVCYESADLNHYPNYISARYSLRMAALDGIKVIFLYPKTELEEIDALKNHIARIQKTENLPVVMILNKLTYRQRAYLIRERIPFVVEGRHIYLPFMALYLQERCDAPMQHRDSMLPSAQLLFLYFIYRGARELPASCAAADLKLTPTSISRASKQLEEMGLAYVKKAGTQRILYAEETAEILFQKSKGKLLNPVKRTVYVSEDVVEAGLLESGYSALAKYSMLSMTKLRCYASDGISKWKKNATNTLQDSKTQVAVELWRYDPRRLSNGGMVDRLSLALSLRDEPDERVEAAVEEMLGDLWREIDGCGNRELQGVVQRQ